MKIHFVSLKLRQEEASNVSCCRSFHDDPDTLDSDYLPPLRSGRNYRLEFDRLFAANLDFDLIRQKSFWYLQMVSPLGIQDISNIGLHHWPTMHQQGAPRSLLISSLVDKQVNCLSHGAALLNVQLPLPFLENVGLMKVKSYDHYYSQNCS